MHFPVSLAYVDPSERYPTGWAYDGKSEVRAGKATNQETWTAMEDVASQGLAKSIGISNFSASLILDLLRYAKIRPAALQIEHHPYLQQPHLLEYAQREGIAVTGYSSFGPQSYVEIEFKKATDTPLLFEHDVVKSLAKKHDRTPAQVLLRWATQRGVAVIPKSNNAERLKQNLLNTEFDLSKEDIEQMATLEKGLRFNNPWDVSCPIAAL